MDVISKPLNVSILETYEESDIAMKEYSSIAEEIGYAIIKDIQIIKKYAEIVENPDSLELKDVHHLLENNIWLINDLYSVYSSNKSLKKAIESKIERKYRSKERKRPDIICKSNFDDYIVFELKRPRHKINLSDFAQLYEYVTIIEQHCPNRKSIEGYLLGSEFDEITRSESLRRTGIHMLSYNEILTNIKFRYKRFIELYKLSTSASI